MIDLRSDTFTVPTEEMRKVMYSAEVGDDVFGEDPSINALQDHCAELFAKEAALYVPSGVMGNQICIALHTERGNEVICEEQAHIFYYEAASPSIISGVQLRTLKSNRGEIPVNDIELSIRPSDDHFPPTRLVCLENTHNRHGGAVLSLNYIKDVRALCDRHNLKFHCDGARIWHSSAATGLKLAEYGNQFDTISVCLSKGMGAPVGSVIVGSNEDIKKAHRWRKILGGGMRQAGIIAAGALHAVKNHFPLLEETHNDAKIFANMISESEKIDINLDHVETNMVVFKTPGIDARNLELELKENGLLVFAVGPESIRAVFHFQNGGKNAKEAAEIVKKTIEKMG